jgi:hypothetical protein
MQSFFAQIIPASPPETSFWKVLSLGLMVLWAIYLVIEIIKHTRRSPSIDLTFATKAELEKGLEKLAKEGESRRLEIDSNINSLRKSLTGQLTNLREKLDEAAARESIEMQSMQRQLGELIGELRASRKPAGQP